MTLSHFICCETSWRREISLCPSIYQRPRCEEMDIGRDELLNILPLSLSLSPLLFLCFPNIPSLVLMSFRFIPFTPYICNIYFSLCLSLRDFLPRGSGIVTRRPLILQLVNNIAGECVGSVQSYVYVLYIWPLCYSASSQAHCLLCATFISEFNILFLTSPCVCPFAPVCRIC